MRWCCAVGAAIAASAAGAHPAPFSYLDLYLDDGAARGTLAVHDFDAAYELGIEDPASLLDPRIVLARGAELVAILDARLQIGRDGRDAAIRWQPVEVVAERDSLRIGFTLGGEEPTGRIAVEATLFPYDPNHQTFVNVYENGRLERQAILDATRPRFEHFTGTPQGRASVVGSFVVSGLEHILIGPDHLAFLLGLLLLGGGLWRLATIVTAFTLGHSITLSLAALNWVRPAPSLVEPAIALSIVVVGVDNLLVWRRRAGGAAFAGTDLRPWLAAAFGLIHGFGFAAVLREIGLPAGALVWSLAGFNLGVEIGQLAIVVLALGLLAAIRRFSVVWFERCAVAGSVAVILAGAYWFVERIAWTA